ncbi:MAG TPA: cyclodeaminase/cyclohydrolase family protein [Candidatus Limnocylindria bacterium]|nr:cyclodeaminase/cyclohydrolase family protein [Candidatus Limnocylindria bacterium]
MDQRLTDLPARELVERLATRDPVPGGGSAAAIAGAIGAALIGMVVELTVGRPEAATHEAALDEVGASAARLRSQLLELAETDAAAYDAVIRARRLPRGTDDEAGARQAAMDDATREATLVPLATASAAAAVLELAERIAPIGNRNAVSDVGVGAVLAGAAVRGAGLNVRINVPYLASEDPLAAEAPREVDRLLADAAERERRISGIVADRMG